jgi:hypothetical protein
MRFSANFIPPIATKVVQAVTTFFEYIATKVSLGLSGAFFTRKKVEAFPASPDPVPPRAFWEIVSQFNDAVKKKMPKVYLPRKVGEWQMSLGEQTRIMSDTTPLFDQYKPVQVSVSAASSSALSSPATPQMVPAMV